MSKIWNQGDKFENTASQAPKQTEVEEPPVQVQEDADTGKKRTIFSSRIVQALIFLGIVLFMGLFLWMTLSARSHNNEVNNNPGTTDDFTNWGDTSGNTDVDGFWGDIFTYTSEEKAELRAWGYTGSEIEDFQLQERDVAELVAESKRLQQEAWDSLNNVESPEYQALLSQTWLGLSDTPIPAYEEYMVQRSEVRRLVADYVKVPPKGGNLFFKVDMKDGSYHFMDVSISEYTKYPDADNINVEYTVHYVGEQEYIYNMHIIEV